MDSYEHDRKVWKNNRKKVNEIMRHMKQICYKNDNTERSSSSEIKRRIKLAMQQCKEKKVTSKFSILLQKSAAQSEKLRKQGNEFFVSRLGDLNLERPYLAYNKSIAYAPNDSIQLALSFANKTALLIDLKKYQECLETIENCLALGKLSDPIKVKVLIRKVECQKILDDPKAVQTYEEALKLIREKMPAADEEKMKLKLDKSFQAEVLRLNSKQHFVDKFIQEFGYLKSNDEVPAASNSVELKYSSECGRHIVATRNIVPGEVLIHEKAYCSTVNLVLSFGYCWHCLNFVWNCVPCDHCVDVVFCSNKCKQEAWEKYHDVECAIICDVEAVYDKEYGKTSALALRLTISAVRELGGIEQLRKEIAEVDKNTDARTKGFEAGIFHSDKYRSVYSLSNTWGPESNGMIPTIMIPILATVTVHLMATKTEFFGKKYDSWDCILNNEDVLFVAEMFAKHFGICSTNSFSVHDYMNGQILPAMSFLNHSCYPNAQYTFKPHSNIVYAVQGIKKGEQVFISYFDAPDKMRMMDSKYFFKCKCVLCENNIPTSVANPSFKQILSNKESVKLLTNKLALIQPILNECQPVDVLEMSPEKALQILRCLFDLLTTFNQHVAMPCSEVLSLRDGISYIFRKKD